MKDHDQLEYLKLIDAKGAELESLIACVRVYLTGTETADSHRWIEIARTDLQQGLMALRRALRQEGGF